VLTGLQDTGTPCSEFSVIQELFLSCLDQADPLTAVAIFCLTAQVGIVSLPARHPI